MEHLKLIILVGLVGMFSWWGIKQVENQVKEADSPFAEAASPIATKEMKIPEFNREIELGRKLPMQEFPEPQIPVRKVPIPLLSRKMPATTSKMTEDLMDLRPKSERVEGEVVPQVVVPLMEGGPSPISSKDGQRAAKAKERVSPQLRKDLEERELTFGSPIFIRIFKETKELELWVKGKGSKFELFRIYRIAAFSGKLGPKTKEGDLQAPEGFYFTNRKKMNPWSSYHLAFNIGYPNEYDRAHKRTGSYIMVHGKNVSIGCFAMTDASIEEIYTLANAAISGGQSFFRIHCFPFRMTDERMAKAEGSEWKPFWDNLLEGYLAFENTHVPPNALVVAKRYKF